MIPVDQRQNDTVERRTSVLNQIGEAVNSHEARLARVEEAVTNRPRSSGPRPAAASVEVGFCFFDTSMNKPIWSDGKYWRDANGDLAFI